MTKPEMAQNEKVFIHAGRTAYRMLITFFGNPYPKNSIFAKLWNIGWREECRATPRVAPAREARVA